MARKKHLEEDSENVPAGGHYLTGSNSNVNHNHLHDNTNRFGHFQQQKQQKLKTNTSNSKINHGQSKGNKIYSTNSGKVEDSFYSVTTQLASKGLAIREMPGDGNCLFRALADQLEGHPRNHLDHRRAVVDFMRKHRPDFEPFVEDDEPFDKYVYSLSQPGTFAGNDAIVAFARLHNVTVVIHQLNSPAWLIHPSSDETMPANGREVHIAYHNGDHYNSVRKLGDDSDAPANVKLSLHEDFAGCTNNALNPANAVKNSPPRSITPPKQPKSPPTTVVSNSLSVNENNTCDNLLYGRRDEDYWVKDSSDIDRLVQDVMEQTDCTDPNFVRETLMEYHFDMVSTVDFILSVSVIMSQSHEEQQPPNEIQKEQTKEHDLSPGSPNKSEHADAEINTANEGEEKMVLSISSSEPSNSNANDLKENLTLGVNMNSSPNRNSPFGGTVADEGTSTQEISNQPSPRHENENKGVSLRGDTNKGKVSSRQKKDQKKRERKKEGDLRKLKENPSNKTSSKSIGIPSNLDAISI